MYGLHEVFRYRLPAAPGRLEAPAPDRFHCSPVEHRITAGGLHFDVTDATLRSDENAQLDLALQTPAPGQACIGRSGITQAPRTGRIFRALWPLSPTVALM